MTLRACLLLLVAGLALGQDEQPITRLFDGDRQVPEDNLIHRFTGDAVLANDKLRVVISQAARRVEVHAKTATGLKHRAAIHHAGTPKIIENNSSAVMVEAAGLRFRLTTGEAILELRANETLTNVTVQSNSRFVVVPDYFGDDVVYDTATARGLYLPAENFCLNLLDGGDAIMMTVWQSRNQDVWLDANSNRIRCLKGKSIWLAFLEAPGIWHTDASSVQPPFPAKWRESQRIVYPLDRDAATPLTVTCPTDVMRNTLGVGPCQYILACEGLAAQGDPTPNSVMTWVEKQFAQKKDKRTTDDIKERLHQMTEHVAHARSRIERYAEFAGQVRKLSAADSFRSLIDDLDRSVTNGLAAPDRVRQLANEVVALIGKENALAPCQRLGKQLRSIGAIQDGALARCRMAVRRLRQQSRTGTVSGTAEVQRLAEQMLEVR